MMEVETSTIEGCKSPLVPVDAGRAEELPFAARDSRQRVLGMTTTYCERRDDEAETAKSLREKVDTERWFFIADWCRQRGLSPMVSENYDRAAMAWINDTQQNRTNEQRL